MKNSLILSFLVILTSCSIFKKSKAPKETCSTEYVSALDLNRTGFVPVTIKIPFPETEPYQIQLSDTSGLPGSVVIKNHITICFTDEKATIQGFKKLMPASSLCCRWDQKKGYFMTNGSTQSVLWAYGEKCPLPSKYKKHLEERKAGKDTRIMAYAVYMKHVIRPVTVTNSDGTTLECYQTLVQQKDDQGKVTSRLIFIVGMQESEVTSLLAGNKDGATFELSDVAYDKKAGKWKPSGEVKGKEDIYTFAWNAEKGAPKLNIIK